MASSAHPLENILAIVGPTATGKSALAMALVKAAQAEHITLEIISMDSALVYRGMDIGTAKPSLDELAYVAHHGINIRDPWESYSAAMFAKDVTQWAFEIRQRGNCPLIVGGTMLYWRALMQGLSNLPVSTVEVRQYIAEQARQVGWDTMYQRLHEIDPLTAARLPPGDTQRVSRALEVFALSGKTMSEFIAENPYADSRDASTFKHHLISLEPLERAWLHERIKLRFEQMLEMGLIEEVKTLLQNPNISPSLPAMRAVGYRQAIQFIQGDYTYAQFIDAGIAASRQLGKRQLTWLRAMPSRKIIDPSKPAFIAEALQECLSHLRQTK
jgi:tRNA dimethylallyltransferase